MKKWTITCCCGHAEDYATLADARRDGKKHLGHDTDGLVYIDQVETEPKPFEDYLTGKTVTLSK